MRSGKRNKNAGGAWERTIVKKLDEYGFKGLGTSRNISRTRDAEKIDICAFDEDKDGRFPYNIQAKNLSKACNYPKVLSEMPEGRQTNVIFHKQTKKVGNRFMPLGEYAIAYLKDFLEIMSNLHKYQEAFELLNEYFDYIPDEEKEDVNKKLEELGL